MNSALISFIEKRKKTPVMVSSFHNPHNSHTSLNHAHVHKIHNYFSRAPAFLEPRLRLRLHPFALLDFDRIHNLALEFGILRNANPNNKQQFTFGTRHTYWQFLQRSVIVDHQQKINLGLVLKNTVFISNCIIMTLTNTKFINSLVM